MEIFLATSTDSINIFSIFLIVADDCVAHFPPHIAQVAFSTVPNKMSSLSFHYAPIVSSSSLDSAHYQYTYFRVCLQQHPTCRTNFCFSYLLLCNKNSKTYWQSKKKKIIYYLMEPPVWPNSYSADLTWDLSYVCNQRTARTKKAKMALLTWMFGELERTNIERLGSLYIRLCLPWWWLLYMVSGFQEQEYKRRKVSSLKG